MYYVIEVINYKYSSPSHHIDFYSESLNEAREYKILKTKLNKIENGDRTTEYIILTPTISKKAA